MPSASANRPEGASSHPHTALVFSAPEAPQPEERGSAAAKPVLTDPFALDRQASAPQAGA